LAAVKPPDGKKKRGKARRNVVATNLETKTRKSGRHLRANHKNKGRGRKERIDFTDRNCVNFRGGKRQRT